VILTDSISISMLVLCKYFPRGIPGLKMGQLREEWTASGLITDTLEVWGYGCSKPSMANRNPT